MRARRVALALLLALLALSGAASAHRNAQVAEGTLRIPAGGAVELPAELHHHRLVGTVAAGDARALLAVRVLGPGGDATLAGPGASLRVNALVACCDDAPWSPHVVRIENRGARAVEAHASLALLHDGLSVAARDAETGAAASLLVIVAIPAALALAAMRRATPARPPAPALRLAAAALAGLALLAAALALPTMRDLGGGPASATIAVAARLPWLANPILTTQDLLMLLLLALWAAALLAWASALRRGGSRQALAALAAPLALLPALSASAWALEYGVLLVPLLAGAFAAAAPLAWALREARRALGAPAPDADDADARA